MHKARNKESWEEASCAAGAGLSSRPYTPTRAGQLLVDPAGPQADGQPHGVQQPQSGARREANKVGGVDLWSGGERGGGVRI